jgi:xanthine dehydrogenase YagS FAD-binding subunit
MVHPSDTATALVALNAGAKITGPRGERVVPLDHYFLGPDDELLRENVLQPEELLLEVVVPVPPVKQAWTKLKDRQVYDFAIVSVAVAFTVEGGRWKDGRIVLGGVSPVPYRATEIENQLRGKDIKKSTKQASALIRKIATPMEMNSYKVDIAQSLVEETILQALG